VVKVCSQSSAACLICSGFKIAAPPEFGARPSARALRCAWPVIGRIDVGKDRIFKADSMLCSSRT
jgi:hypothetical protein